MSDTTGTRGSGAGTSLAARSTSDLIGTTSVVPLARFFSELVASAVLYKTDETWKLSGLPKLPDVGDLDSFNPPGDAASSTDSPTSTKKWVRFTASVLFAPETPSASNQPYWNPELITIPPDWTQSILVISLSPGGQGVTEDNRQAHAFRIKGKPDKTIAAEYLGAFGGATSSTVSNETTVADDDNPSSALGAPAAPVIGAFDEHGLLIQAPFTLVHRLTQRSTSPITFAFSLQGGVQSGGDNTDGNTSGSANVQFQFGWGTRYQQLTPPPPTFVVSCNVILKPASDTTGTITI